MTQGLKLTWQIKLINKCVILRIVPGVQCGDQMDFVILSFFWHRNSMQHLRLRQYSLNCLDGIHISLVLVAVFGVVAVHPVVSTLWNVDIASHHFLPVASSFLHRQICRLYSNWCTNRSLHFYDSQSFDLHSTNKSFSFRQHSNGIPEFWLFLIILDDTILFLF